MSYNYEGRIFRSVSNSGSGEVGGETRFHYHQQGTVVWGDYSGGDIARGALLAIIDAQGCLEMRYHHVNLRGELKTGICHSTPEVLPDGRYRLLEKWTWTCDDRSSGESMIEEISVNL